MMLYLTGAEVSLESSGGDSPQTEAIKSLGGYISSSPVPNGSVNALFDDISLMSKERKQSETIALGLINESGGDVSATLKVITVPSAQANFEVAVTETINSTMEKIGNRYSEPMSAVFHKADFSRASASAVIQQYGGVGDKMSFSPFNVEATIETVGYDGTWQAIEKAFRNSEYIAIRLNEREFMIQNPGDDEINPVKCEVISTGTAKIEFTDDLKNVLNGKVSLGTIKAGQKLGLWIKRTPTASVKSNVELLKEREDKAIIHTEETVEIAIEYNPL